MPEKKLKKETKLTLIVIVLFAAFFFILDFILGLFLIPDSYSDFRIKNAYYHHGLKPNVETMAAWGPIIYPFYTNNFGFRDATARTIPLVPDQTKIKKRILIMGDSHSEGVGIPFEFTFSGRLQKMGESKNIEILNASAVSYSPKIHYLKADHLINHLGLVVDEIWVVIDISDLQNEIAYEYFIPQKQTWGSNLKEKFAEFFQKNSLVVFSINRFGRNQEIEKFQQTLRGFNEEVDVLPNPNAIELYKDFFSHFDDESMLQNPDFHGVGEWIYDPALRKLADKGLENGFDNLSKLNRLCQQNNIQLRLSVHPWQTQVLKGDTTDYYVERWREFCDAENIDFINLFPLFINHENPHYVNKVCYIEGDNHWNETGNKRVADHLSVYLD